MTETPQSGGRSPDDPHTTTPRWERESQEELRLAEQEPQPTTEWEFRSSADERPGELRGPPEYPADGAGPPATQGEGQDDDEQWPEREPRMATARESLSATRESLSATATKVGRWLHSLDRRPEFDAGTGRDPVAELTSGDPDSELGPVSATGAPAGSHDPHDGDHGDRDEREDDDAGVRFPSAALGYNRHAVDRYVAELEEEIAALVQRVDPPVSITEEIERLGEQTASILVVAHDKAHETARRAQEQAARAVSEASDNAERITAAAERRLRELDEETDAVWRERERLLEDVREVSRTLATLADAASERFPAAPEAAAPAAATSG